MFSKLFGGKKPGPPADNQDTEAPIKPLASETAPEEIVEPVRPGLFGMNSFVDRMRQAVSRTRESLSTRLEGVLAMTRTVDETDLDELEAVLLTSDLGLPTTTAILDQLRDRARRKDIAGGEELRQLLKEQIRAILELPVRPRPDPALPPKVIFLVGVNGTGKTTTTGKLAAWFRGKGKTVLLCAADTFRAAAIEQLEVWASRSGVDMIRTRQGGDPSAVLYDAVSAAQARATDVLVVDTAGRLHTKGGLMDELDKMRRIARKLIPEAPHEVLLVMDATTGQNGLQQARLFTEASGVTGIVLTKLDGTAKGGIAVAIARELLLPVRYIGVGEKINDLLEFDSSAFVDSLLGE